MINCRFRRCHCMNYNPHCYNTNMMEKACNNENKCCKNEEIYNENCSCGFDEDEEIDVFPKNPLLGQSYVPIQYMEETFIPCTGLEHGTLFPELVSQYKPCDSMRDIEFLRNTNSVKEGCNASGRE